MIEYRDYQLAIIELGTSIIQVHGYLYLAMEVRTGKTLTSLGICERLNVEHVLFLTKKKAISSITKDFDMLCPTNYILFTINYESMHKLPDVKWDVIICDEAHSLGAFPKPNKRAKAVRDLIQKCNSKVLLMSGTPTPESYSQMYHQVYGIPNNPFSHHKSFYKFAHEYVNVTQRKINGMFINDYSKGLKTILDVMTPYTIRFTQENAGFKVKTTENVLEVEMDKATYDIAKRLQKNLVVEGKAEVILADTPVKLMMKLHQIFSGTVKFESGNSMVMDYSKAEFIKKHFKGKKIGIFYKFKAELAALKETFGDELTTELVSFDETNKSIALQIVSGREGLSLRNAEALVYYNIDFSATSYWQSRDRMTTKDRLFNDVYWIFAKGGIEKQIYKAVTKKKDYTLYHFKKDFVSLQ
jgi:SNF2 family DNA or RNA helicase